MTRDEYTASRLAVARAAVRKARYWPEVHALLAPHGLTYAAVKGMYRRAGLRPADDLGADHCPPTQPSQRPVEEEPRPAIPPPPSPGVGWVAHEPEERIIFVPDAHVPFVDRVAWGVMMACARRFRPTRIVVLGDFLDFYQVSDHEKDPRRCTSLQSDVEEANGLLDELDALGATHRHFCEGNHEFRLTRYLWTKAPALLASVKLPDLLRLEARGWTWTPYRQHLRIHDLWVTHETGHAGAWAHHRSAADFMGSVAIGHTHRLGVHAFGNAHGERFTASMFGWLGSAPDADYMHSVKKARDWSHGFGLGWVIGGKVIVQAVPIVDRAAVVDGLGLAAPLPVLDQPHDRPAPRRVPLLRERVEALPRGVRQPEEHLLGLALALRLRRPRASWLRGRPLAGGHDATTSRIVISSLWSPSGASVSTRSPVTLAR